MKLKYRSIKTNKLKLNNGFGKIKDISKGKRKITIEKIKTSNKNNISNVFRHEISVY